MSSVKMIFFIAILAYLSVGASPVVFAEEAHVQASAADKFYYCPMHPQVVSDKPGECPICHMRLVLNDPAHAGSVSIPAGSRELLNIRSEPVQKKVLKKTLEAWGELAHDPELYEMQIEFLRTERLNYERVRERTPVAKKRPLNEREKLALRLQEQGLSDEWIRQLTETGVPDKRLIAHHAAGGSWVYLQMREKDAALVEPGNIAHIRVPALPGVEFEGRVEFVDSVVDMTTNTIRVRVLVQNEPLSVKPNMSVSATLEIDLGEGLVVPDQAVLFSGKNTCVFVEKDGTFTRREVVLGEKVDGHYEVKNGVMEGEIVASSGNFFVDSESRLRASIAGSAHGSHT